MEWWRVNPCHTRGGNTHNVLHAVFIGVLLKPLLTQAEKVGDQLISGDPNAVKAL